MVLGGSRKQIQRKKGKVGQNNGLEVPSSIDTYLGTLHLRGCPTKDDEEPSIGRGDPLGMLPEE